MSWVSNHPLFCVLNHKGWGTLFVLLLEKSRSFASLRMTTLKLTVHDEGVDVALFRVVEGSGKATDNFEAEFFPEAHGHFVGTDDDVELHGAEAAFAGAVERMGAHRAGDATA